MPPRYGLERRAFEEEEDERSPGNENETEEEFKKRAFRAKQEAGEVQSGRGMRFNGLIYFIIAAAVILVVWQFLVNR